MLLKAGADPNACSVNPIIAAIKAKNYKAMRAFYENGVAPSVSEEHQQSPIQFALMHNDPRLLTEILEWKDMHIDFGTEDPSGRNIFHTIAQSHDVEAFKLLMGKVNPMDRNTKLQIKQQLNKSMDKTGNQPFLTPLYFCQPDKELAKLFCLYGADPSELSFLHCFFSIRPNFDYIEFLITELHLDIEEFDVAGLTALGHVYKEQNYEQIVVLVRLGAKIDRPMLENGRTLLMDAAMRGNSGMF